MQGNCNCVTDTQTLFISFWSHLKSCNDLNSEVDTQKDGQGPASWSFLWNGSCEWWWIRMKQKLTRFLEWFKNSVTVQKKQMLNCYGTLISIRFYSQNFSRNLEGRVSSICIFESLKYAKVTMRFAELFYHKNESKNPSNPDISRSQKNGHIFTKEYLLNNYLCLYAT